MKITTKDIIHIITKENKYNYKFKHVILKQISILMMINIICALGHLINNTFIYLAFILNFSYVIYIGSIIQDQLTIEKQIIKNLKALEQTQTK